jgi:anti-anti-sigma factor
MGVAMTLKIVKLDGDLDFSRKAQIATLLADADNADIAIIDLSDVSYIDSSCLSCLAIQKKTMHENGTAAVLRIAGASESVRRILQICGLDKTFEMYASLDEAQNAGAAYSR